MRPMGDWFSLDALILRSAALLVPHWRRADWLAEWRSELWYVLQGSDPERRSFWNRKAMFFCLGAFRDALWFRCNDRTPEPRQHLWLQSPLQCLLFLATLAGVATLFFFRSSGTLDTLLRASQGHRERIFAHFLMILIASLTLPATTSLALGEYPGNPCSPARALRFRRWIFLALKFSLILPIVFCGTFDLAPIVSATGLQPHATLVGYALAFRWALIDQRRRCPVCLRLLANPATIGQPANTFLGWYGTELFCIKGHGLLHVPAIPTSYSTQRWLDLDASWSCLFSRRTR
jgi:hypothetical protein